MFSASILRHNPSLSTCSCRMNEKWMISFVTHNQKKHRAIVSSFKAANSEEHSHHHDGHFGGFQFELGEKAWEIDETPKVYWFAISSARSLMLDGDPLEEVLGDAIDTARKEKRPRDVWLVFEPAFLEQHPGFSQLKVQLERPAAAIISTNAGWMVSVVKSRLPKAIIGKLKAPSLYVPNPLKSSVKSEGAIIGGGGVWH